MPSPERDGLCRPARSPRCEHGPGSPAGWVPRPHGASSHKPMGPGCSNPSQVKMTACNPSGVPARPSSLPPSRLTSAAAARRPGHRRPHSPFPRPRPTLPHCGPVEAHICAHTHATAQPAQALSEQGMGGRGIQSRGQGSPVGQGRKVPRGPEQWPGLGCPPPLGACTSPGPSPTPRPRSGGSLWILALPFPPGRGLRC